MPLTHQSTRILVVDDEVGINQLVSTNLMIEGYTVQAAYNSREALTMFTGFAPHLVLLDVMMPNMDGFEVLQQIRLTSNVPVIMLTARMQISDRVKGLNLGADDYLVKPFSIDELLARVSAILRRAASAPVETVSVTETLTADGIECDVTQHKVLVAGKEVVLQNLEFRLLAALMRSKNRVLSYDYLLSTLWDNETGDMNSLRVTIGKLRTKLTGAGASDVIETHHGLGYRFKD